MSGPVGEHEPGQDEHDNVYPPSPEGSQGNSVNDGFNHMMNHINQEEGEVEDEDPDILKVLEDVEAVEDYGPPVVDHVAVAFNKTAERPLSKETGEALKKGMKIPDNCKALQVPKVNPEIWQHLRTRPKVNDIRLQQTQMGYSVALSTLAMISNEIALASKSIPKDLVTKLLKIGMDGANLIGNQMQEVSKRRRQEIKPYLSHEYAGICNEKIPPGEYLFGSNLAETMKSTKTTSGVVRNLGLSRHRAHPFSQPQQRYSSLNQQRPFTSNRGRWNGPQRGTGRSINRSHQQQSYPSRPMNYNNPQFPFQSKFQRR